MLNVKMIVGGSQRKIMQGSFEVGGDDINTKNKNVETSTFVDSLRFDRFLQEMGTRYNNMYTRSADEDSLPEIENLQSSMEIKVIQVVCFVAVYYQY